MSARKTWMMLAAAIGLLAFAILPAQAHRLKLFATVENGEIRGQAFFVGGGAPKGAAVVFRNDGGDELHRTRTNGSGHFAWRPARAQNITIILNVGDGHAVRKKLPAELFRGKLQEKPQDKPQDKKSGDEPHSKYASKADASPATGNAAASAIADQPAPVKVGGGIAAILVAGALLFWVRRRNGAHTPNDESST